jgi:outer membrane receptor protein involved in Fe transport
MTERYLRHFMAALLMFATGALFAQGGKATLSGTIKDSTQKPLHYATVELVRPQQPTQVLKSTYTSDKGKFTITGVDTGSYQLIVSHTGYAEQRQDLTVADGRPLEIKEIALRPATGTLQGVTVQARKPLIEQADDKIVFNVENDPTTKTETAIDILRKTPFVSVDGDGNVQVNGQTNFKVLLNGRETAMFAQNVKEALKGFPGALITKIEVITTPSAKYDAEGVGGIINIITKKKVAGFNGSISANYTTSGWFNGNTNFSYKKGKVGITVNYGGNGSQNIMGRSRMETIPFVPTTFERRTLEGTRQMKNFWNFGNAEFSYELDSLNTLSLYGNLSGGRHRSILDQTITTELPSGDDVVSYYDLSNRNEFPTRSVGSDYIKKFNANKEKEFSIRFNGEFGNANNFLNSVMDNPSAPDRYVINNSEAVNRQYTLQSDYIYPLKNNRKLETGVKAILRRASSDFESLIRTNPNDDFELNADNTDNFNYQQDVYSAYSTYSLKSKKTTFRLGARLEHTEVFGNFSSAKTEVKQRYTNVLPNLQSTTKLTDKYTLVLTYSERLQRPYIWNLNPFKNNNDPLYVSYGNPELDPQIIRSLSAQTRFSKGTTFAGITLTGSYSDNMIVQYATFDPNTGVTSTTSGNLGQELQVSVNANISAKITPEWNVFLNGNVRYNRVQNKMLASQVNSGIGGNGNLNTSYSITKKFTASGFAGFWRGPVTIQTQYPLNIWYGAGLGYKFFKEKLTTSLSAFGFLEKERDYKLITRDPAFQYTSVTTMPFRGLSMSLTWNFGKMTENVSKKKGVTNDDLIGGGQSN